MFSGIGMANRLVVSDWTNFAFLCYSEFLLWMYMMMNLVTLLIK